MYWNHVIVFALKLKREMRSLQLTWVMVGLSYLYKTLQYGSRTQLQQFLSVNTAKILPRCQILDSPLLRPHLLLSFLRKSFTSRIHFFNHWYGYQSCSQYRSQHYGQCKYFRFFVHHLWLNNGVTYSKLDPKYDKSALFMIYYNLFCSVIR